ncbi:MBL fold metallo-hydrolase [Paenibacillus nasutitermitis]|uniref:MBL fold hydrolase n=1 Tax=Paenibacillus nasutitermitis TaxID=1652958 RepID=A0A916Z4Y1_9BACL|nr:MBL fold metallo-hydrolase [Paenibacillus nasutitermitis]GGD73950.1 MBL fold hydrolase [Paenibacillus nasutitermitis]
MNGAVTAGWPEGMIQVKVPLPFSLKWVNSYLLPGEDGYTLIDPGLHTPDAVNTWREALVAHGIDYKDIGLILLTHQHPDHYGLAGWFQQRTDAPVLISRRSHSYALRLWGEDDRFALELTGLYALHGMPGGVLETIGPHLAGFREMVTPQPEVSYMAAGETLRLGNMDWLTIDAPGHANGQLCLYNAKRRWMFCGDQVLPDITPNVSVVPGEDGDPLQQFLDSLAHLQTYEVELAFPGHRDPFTGFHTRITELLRHHERRLAEIIHLLVTQPCSGYELCQRLFGERIAGNAHQLRFAMSETLAHLFHLENRRQIHRHTRKGYVVFMA